jgi:hypothetical protein
MDKPSEAAHHHVVAVASTRECARSRGNGSRPTRPLEEARDHPPSAVRASLNKFRKPGFIDYNGALKVNNSLLGVLLRD